MKLNKFAITLFLLLAVLATVTLAQDEEKTSTSSPARAEQTTTTTTIEEKTTSTTEAPKETSTTSTTEEEKETSTTEKTTETTPTEGPPALTTSTTSTSTSETSEAVITDESGETLPPKPKLTTVKEYPKPTVPPTAGAPFMQKSSVPEGTFFIAVGAALGFLMFSVFAWRMIVAWSLHRSVKRAAEQANVVDSKAMLRPPQIGGNSGGFYAAGGGSAVSLGDLSRGGAAAKQTPNGSSLFFSPTAGVNAAGDRRSAYLPAGYYPTNGSGSLGPNSSQTHFHSHSVSSRYGSYDRRGLGPSPPGSPLISPSMPPSRGGNGSPALRGSESRTSLSIPPLPGQRAPSAYLEDLFENHQQQPGGRY